MFQYNQSVLVDIIFFWEILLYTIEIYNVSLILDSSDQKSRQL